jgi:hypothetical protein
MARRRASTTHFTLRPQALDVGKNITGRKRHVLVDMLGLLLSVIVHPSTCRIAMVPARC